MPPIALARIGPSAKSAIPQLIQSLDDKDGNVQNNTIISLALLADAFNLDSDDSGIPFLEDAAKALKHRNSHEASYASFAVNRALASLRLKRGNSITERLSAKFSNNF